MNQLLGDFPQIPYGGFAPEPHWGLPSPRPPIHLDPHFLKRFAASGRKLPDFRTKQIL